MEEKFWATKWEKNEIGFHLSTANPALVRNINELSLEQTSRIFLPLCGKTLDIKWLLAQGYRIVGAELIEDAIKQLFAELEVEPTVTKIKNTLRYSATDIDVYVGNIFDLTGELIGEVDAIYDRAALVALPEEVRTSYTSHLISITNQAPQLLISFVYDQAVMPGPPFSVTDDEVIMHYGDVYAPKRLEVTEVVGGLKGICPATEHVWLLQNR